MPPFEIGDEAAPNLELTGYERGRRQVFTGESWGMALWWLASAPLEPYTISLDLVDESGGVSTLLETRPVYDTYPFDEWQTPQFVIDRQNLTIPADFIAGEYRLNLRLVDADGEALYASDLGPLQIEATERIFSAPPLAHEVNATFGDEISLVGYDLSPIENGAADLALVWHALQTPTADYTIFVHLLNPDGTCCAWQQDSTPQAGTHATGRWLPGEVVVDEYEIVLPAGSQPGDYPIEVGLYIAETGQRLGIEAADGTTSDALQLQSLPVPWNSP